MGVANGVLRVTGQIDNILPENGRVATVPLDAVGLGEYVRWTGHGKDLLICRLAEGLYAIDNLCSHKHMRLDGGELDGNRLICPAHDGAFDVCTGAALTFPAERPIRSFACHLVDGMIHVDLGGHG